METQLLFALCIGFSMGIIVSVFVKHLVGGENTNDRFLRIENDLLKERNKGLLLIEKELYDLKKRIAENQMINGNWTLQSKYDELSQYGLKENFIYEEKAQIEYEKVLQKVISDLKKQLDKSEKIKNDFKDERNYYMRVQDNFKSTIERLAKEDERFIEIQNILHGCEMFAKR